MPVNTLQVANRLKAAEKEGRTAEELALVLGEIEAERYERLVTREHMQAEFDKVYSEFDKVYAEFGRVRGEIGQLRTELLAEIEKSKIEIKHDMTLRLGGMIAAATTILGGLNIFF